MRYKHIIFDLDGTLSNSYCGITNAVKYALEAMGIEVKSRKELKKFIGPPLIHTFMGSYGMNRSEGDRAVELFREYYTEKGVYENSLFEGEKELLSYIKSGGGKMYIATSKPQKFAETVLDFLKISDYFTFVRGVSFEEAETEKDMLIEDIINKFGLDKSETVMVGDTRFDIEGAKKAGVTAVGVLYGFGEMEELKKADATAETALQLKDIL